MAAREVAHLRFPIGVVSRKLVQEDDRRSAACLLEIEAKLILGDGIGHFGFLFCGRRKKLQLMLAAAMRQFPIVFRHEICAESPVNCFRTAATNLAVAIPRRETRFAFAQGRADAGNGGIYRGLTMLRMVAFCRPLVVALALCTAAIAVSATSATARPHHRSAHRAQAYVSHQVRWHNVQNHSRHHYRYVRREAPQVSSPGDAFVAPAAASATRIIRYRSRPPYRHAIRQASREQMSLLRGRAALSKALPFPTRAA